LVEKTSIALVLAAILTIFGYYATKENREKSPREERRRLYSFLILAFPFVVVEIVTGVVSHLTGFLSIPPLFGLGIMLDVAILTIGLVVLSIFHTTRGFRKG